MKNKKMLAMVVLPILADDNWEKIATIKRPKMPETLPDIPSHEEMTILGSGAV
jgi:hypothetical protein